jgi:hypothetical protein
MQTVNAQPDTTDAHLCYVKLANVKGMTRARALKVGWVAVHRVYSEPDADGWCRTLYRLTHVPSGRAICDVAAESIHVPYGIACLFVKELPTAPESPSPEALRLGGLVAECAVPWIVMLPQDEYVSYARPLKAVAS